LIRHITLVGVSGRTAEESKVLPNDIKYTMYLETPTLEHYRLDWVPGPDVQLAGMWAPAVITDAAGQDYLGLRGWGDFLQGMTHTVSPFCGFRALQPSLDGDPPHLYSEYSGHDWFEPFDCVETEDSVWITYDSGRLGRDESGCHWYDADGRWEIHGRTISKIFVVHVPQQPGIEQEVYYRHELLLAHGTVNGAPVSGYLHQDYCYGAAGTTYTDLPIARMLEGMWVSWIHEDADGELGGGCFWQGRGDLDFRPGYLLNKGETSAHGDVVADLTFNQADQPTALHVEIGMEVYDFKLDSATSPMHYFGRLVSSSSGKEPARSWCWIEYAETLMTPEILDMMGQKFRLARGRQRRIA
jgi:hypothetical protein